jgi:hypothetical protein
MRDGNDVRGMVRVHRARKSHVSGGGDGVQGAVPTYQMQRQLQCASERQRQRKQRKQCERTGDGQQEQPGGSKKEA